MGDVFNVTAAYDKATYNKGDLMTVTISGGDVLTQVNSAQSGTLTLTITAADGSTTSIALPDVTINTTTTTPESVKITGAVDSTARPWTIASNGLSVTATA
jgi:Bacterial Ig-like domain (group 3)